MATITKRGDLQFQARVRRRGHDVMKTFLSRADAVAWGRKIESEIDRSVWHDTSEAERTTVRELLERYQDEEGDRFRSTRAHPPAIKNLIAGLGKLTLSELTSARLARWRDERKKEVSQETVRRELGILRAAINIAIRDWGIVLPRGNPVSLIRLPSPGPSRDRRLSKEEEQRLLRECEHYEKDARSLPIGKIIRFAIATAMRRGEIASLRWENIDLQRRVALLPLTKNGEARRVPLSTAALEALPSPLDELVGDVWGATEDAITKAFGRILKRARNRYCEEQGDCADPDLLVGIRFHDLRHEGVSRLIERGLNIMEVSAVSGHKSLDMLKRYTHLRAEDIALKLA